MGVNQAKESSGNDEAVDSDWRINSTLGLKLLFEIADGDLDVFLDDFTSLKPENGRALCAIVKDRLEYWKSSIQAAKDFGDDRQSVDHIMKDVKYLLGRWEC